jgi:hypothetical protein
MNVFKLLPRAEVLKAKNSGPPLKHERWFKTFKQDPPLP